MTHPTSFYLDDAAKETLQRLVAETGMSRSQVVKVAIKEMGMKNPKQVAKLREAIIVINDVLGA